MKQVTIISLFTLVIFSCSDPFLKEKITENEGLIPYEKYELENGLTLLIHEDHSDPIVHVDVTYHVGSAREEIGKSGFAHFFEHMMFQGSQNVADEEHFKIITEAGGTLNGTTNRDRTNYFETVPSDQLEIMLWLESDRMGFFLDAVTQKKFDVQQATVKNEKQQNFDNRPYGRWSEITAETLYPYGHPYSWLTIGKMEELDLMKLEDLKKFFLRWYGPNNATLTIAGDVEPESVLKLVKKYFGSIPPGPEVEKMILEPVKLEADRYASYYDPFIRFPALIMTYPTVPNYHPDEPALDCLSEILGQGKTSHLYKEFITTQKAIQANASHPCSELAGEFSMFVLPFPGKSLTETEKELRASLGSFKEEDISEEDIEKFKAQFESRLINGLSTVAGKGSQLAAYETFLGNPNYTQEQLDKYLAVTKEDVVRVYRKYIKDQPAVILSVLANKEDQPAQSDNYEVDKSHNPFPQTDYSGLIYETPESTFDRSIKPEPGDPPVVSVPAYWEEEFENGVEVIGTKYSEIPIVSITLNFEAGHIRNSDNPDLAGVASITGQLMNEATENYTAEEIARELEKLGSAVSIGAGGRSASVSLWSLKKNLDATLEIMEEKLIRPAFRQKDFDRIKRQQYEAILAAEKQPSAITSQVFRTLRYGRDHIFTSPSSGFPETIEKITLDDVKEFYETYYKPTKAELVIVGDITKEEILSKLDFLQDWEKSDVEEITLPSLPKKNQTTIYVVNMEGAAQSEIRIGYATGITYEPLGESYKTQVMNYPLGGAFNSRINLNLREDKGYTYGARSSFSAGEEYGFFTASASVKANVTDSAVMEFLKELKDYRLEGPTEEEVNFTQQAIGRSDALKYESPRQKAGFLQRIITYDLDRDYVKKQTALLQSLTEAQLDELAQIYMQPNQMDILIVGDTKVIGEGLKKLPYPIVELDLKGNPVMKE